MEMRQDCQIENRQIKWKSVCWTIPQVSFYHLFTEGRLRDSLWERLKSPRERKFWKQTVHSVLTLQWSSAGDKAPPKQRERDSNHFSEPHSLILMACQQWASMKGKPPTWKTWTNINKIKKLGETRNNTETKQKHWKKWENKRFLWEK